MVARIKDDGANNAFSRVTALFQGIDLEVGGGGAQDLIYTAVLADGYSGSGSFGNNILTINDETAIETVSPSASDYSDLTNPIIVSTGLIKVSGSTKGNSQTSAQMSDPFRYTTALPSGKVIGIVLGNINPSGTAISDINIYGTVEFGERW